MAASFRKEITTDVSAINRSPEIGDMAIITWLQPNVHTERLPGKPYDTSVTDIFEHVFMGYVIMSPQDIQRRHTKPTGLKALEPKTPELAEMYHIGSVYKLGERVVGEISYQQWLDGDEPIKYCYEKCCADLIIDPTSDNISVTLASADIDRTLPPDF